MIPIITPIKERGFINQGSALGLGSRVLGGGACRSHIFAELLARNISGLGFRVWGLGFKVLGFKVLGFWV